VLPILAVGPALSLLKSLTDSTSSTPKTAPPSSAEPGKVTSFADILTHQTGKTAK
jgi:hypothetical protein